MLSLLFVVFLLGKMTLAVEIIMDVQLSGESTASCGGGDTITVTNDEDLRKQITEKLEALLINNPGNEVTITTHFFHGDDVHSHTSHGNSYDVTPTTDHTLPTSTVAFITTTPTDVTSTRNDVTTRTGVTTPTDVTTTTGVTTTTDATTTADVTTPTDATTPTDVTTTTNVTTTTASTTTTTDVNTITDAITTTSATTTTASATTLANVTTITNVITADVTTDEFTTRISTSSRPSTFEVTTTKESKATRCDLNINGTCYWAEFSWFTFSFPVAQRFCEGYNSTAAIITNEDAYNEITTYLRTKIPRFFLFDGIKVWTGAKINPNNGAVDPANAFVDWEDSSPDSHDIKTNILLYVPRKKDDDPWMENIDPSTIVFGVLCSFQT